MSCRMSVRIFSQRRDVIKPASFVGLLLIAVILTVTIVHYGNSVFKPISHPYNERGPRTFAGHQSGSYSPHQSTTMQEKCFTLFTKSQTKKNNQLASKTDNKIRSRNESSRTFLCRSALNPDHGNNSQRRPHVFTHGNYGGLGNYLFPFASVIGIALKNNRTPWISTNLLKELSKHFTLAECIQEYTIELDKYLNQSNFQDIWEKSPRHYNHDFDKLPAGKNVRISTYLEVPQYFSHAEDELRYLLTFKPHLLNRAHIFLDKTYPHKWKGSAFARVAIHVRRKNYMTSHLELFPGIIFAESDYFKRAMALFETCYQRVQFIVLSDDIDWCKKNILSENVVYSEGHTPGEDLALASLCDHVIVTHGTFGWWAAWFANGIMVHQCKASMPDSEAKRSLDVPDFYPTDSICL